MRETMIADRVSLLIDPSDDIRIFLCIFSDHKKCSNNTFLLQDIEYLWCQSTIWSIIEREGDFFVHSITISPNNVWKRKLGNILIGDNRSREYDIARSDYRLTLESIKFASTLIIDIISVIKILKPTRIIVRIR